MAVDSHHIVRRAHMSFKVGRSDIDCLRRNNILVTQGAPFTRREIYWDSPTFSLRDRGFCLKEIVKTGGSSILEEISGIHAEGPDRRALLPLVASGHAPDITKFATLFVEIGVYSIRTLGGFRIELQRTSWELFEDLIFCNRLDVITRSECLDPKGACQEIVAAMERFGISQKASPVGLSYLDNVFCGSVGS